MALGRHRRVRLDLRTHVIRIIRIEAQESQIRLPGTPAIHAGFAVVLKHEVLSHLVAILVRGLQGFDVDAIDYAPNFVFQTILAVEFLIDRSSRDDLQPSIKALRDDIASKCDVLPKKSRGGGR